MRATALVILFLMGALVALPVVMRPAGESAPDDAERLIVITPHNEQIRQELARGFTRWMQQTHKRDAVIDWRDRKSVV